MKKYYPGVNSFLAYILEYIQFVQDKPTLRMQRDKLIQRMIDEKATISTTTHLFGSFCNRTYFKTILVLKLGADNPDLSQEQLKRLNIAFDSFMGYIKNAHDKGLQLRIGTDCKDGGQALLSELLLFAEAGFSIKDILQIATINGARSMNLENKYGSLTKGKKADLIIFDKNPFDNYKNFLKKKTVIKDGVVYSG
jgi:Amidohydrolase family